MPIHIKSKHSINVYYYPILILHLQKPQNILIISCENVKIFPKEKKLMKKLILKSLFGKAKS